MAMFTALFSSCCCTPPQEDDFAHISLDDELQPCDAMREDGYQPHLPALLRDASRSSAGLADKGRDPAKAQSPGGGPPAAETQERKEEEKTRLQNLVTGFVKKGIAGLPCTFLREEGGTVERIPATYRVHKALDFITLSFGSSGQEVRAPLAEIQDIFHLQEDPECCFPLEVLAALEPQERERLLMMAYRRHGHGEHMLHRRICLLEKSPESREAFLECMKILCIYAQGVREAEADGRGERAPAEPEEHSAKPAGGAASRGSK